MEFVRLGSTGMKVSRICLGCMGFGDADALGSQMGARRGKQPADYQESPRAGDQFLRYGQCLFHWKE